MGSFCSSRNDPNSIAAYFNDKIVWITGSSGGFGEALAVELCRVTRAKGLILSARRAEELERVKRRCLELQPDMKVTVLPLDLSDLDVLAQKAKEANSIFGAVDVLINNGGVGFRGIALETPLEKHMQVMKIDYFSGVALTQALLPLWLKAKSGHVVQIASVQSFFGLPGRTAYSAAKHAAVGFYDSLRAELVDTGISVTVVCPGYIKTNHSQNAVQGSDGGYPEGHTSKGVAPELLAIEALTAVARKKAELVSSAIDARIATMIRGLCPPVIFSLMAKRARKELRERCGLLEEATSGKKDE